tara:strand:+ start:90 stop:809 length:720 start_codon:yes stop_codon:yes gene_type:complete
MKNFLKKIIKINLLKISDLIIKFTSSSSPKVGTLIDKSKPSNKEEVLFQILEFLNSNKFDYFLSGGTLLGIIRDGKLIEWDDDIDINVFSYSYRNNFKKILNFANQNGYPFHTGPNYFHHKIVLCIKNTKVSITSITRGIFKRNYFYRSKKRLPYVTFNNCKKIKINNKLFARVPNNSSDYLKFIYGSDWKKPFKWEDENKADLYNYGYIRRGKRYALIDHFQLLLSKLTYLLKKFFFK